MRYITTPEGKQVSIGAFVSAWRRLKAMDPDAEVRGWQWWPTSARNILRDIRRGMNDRISQGISYNLRGKE